jgi:hypothetical protein
MMQAAVPFAIGALALSGCVASVPPAGPGPIVLDGVSYDVTRAATGALRVSRQGKPFANWEGMEARRAADRFCNGRADSSIRDRFQGETWLIVEGCA